jgi:hypothetical protein
LGKDGGFFLHSIPNVREHAEFIASAPAVIKQKDALIAELVSALEVSQATIDCVATDDFEKVHEWRKWAGIEDALSRIKTALDKARSGGAS